MTGRISNLHDRGHLIEARRVDGVWRYWVKDRSGLARNLTFPVPRLPPGPASVYLRSRGY